MFETRCFERDRSALAFRVPAVWTGIYTPATPLLTRQPHSSHHELDKPTVRRAAVGANG
jgi:hypothetical protein